MHRLTYSNRTLSIIIIVAAISILSAVSASAQYSKMRDFGSQPEGAYPFGQLATDGTFFYGITQAGGPAGTGTIYKMDASGNITIIHTFDTNLSGGGGPNSLLYSGSKLYGMSYGGGSNNSGFIYTMNTDGTAFTDIFDFDYSVTGGYPVGGLITDGTMLYGLCPQGGSLFYGTIFKVGKDGSGFQKLFEFDNNNPGNGSQPYGNLTLNGTDLYGTTFSGGDSYHGTIFKIKTDGTNFTRIHAFNGGDGSQSSCTLFFDGTFLWGTTQTGGFGNGVLFRILPDGTNYTPFSYFNLSADGYKPKGSLISDGTYLYGTTSLGGTLFGGTLFKIKLDGSGYTTIANLSSGSFGPQPDGTPKLVGSTLYMTRADGGHSSLGEVYKINTDGSNGQSLYSFHSTGYQPMGGMISDGTFLYGVTMRGGEYDQGTVYKIKPDGTGFLKLADFDNAGHGSWPQGRLYYDGTKLYGTTYTGGSNNVGTIYSLNTDGSAFTNLLNLSNANGASSSSSLISDGTFLYGMTQVGGTNGRGTIFKLKPNGTGYVKLYDFDDAIGSIPEGDLILDGGVLYGTSYNGNVDAGMIFKINTDGSNFQKLHGFDYTHGANPSGGLLANGSFFYGVTTSGSSYGNGVVFKIGKNGTGYTVLDSLDYSMGYRPDGSLITDGTYLYGITNNTLFRTTFDGNFNKMMDFTDGQAGTGTLYSDGTFLYGITQTGGVNDKGTLFKRSVIPSVAVTTFEPKYGTEGTYITISGNDFDTDPTKNTVKFNGITAKVVSSAYDSIVALVPVGATSGAITVTKNGITDTSTESFTVTDDAVMNNVKVQTCNATFTGVPGDKPLFMTFEPSIPGAKIIVTFTDGYVTDDLYVYNGLGNQPSDVPADTVYGNDVTDYTYTSTAAGGELSFWWVFEDQGSDWTASITCSTSTPQITVSTQPQNAVACPGVSTTFTTSASGPNNITYQWQFSSIGTSWQDLNDAGGYTGTKTPSLTVVASKDLGGYYRCNISGGGIQVVSDEATLTVNSCDLNVFNAVSPNNDGKNEILYLENIETIASKKENVVKIYNRWGEEVFSVKNYNNTSNVFNGTNKNGGKLPSGTYYYKISFNSGDKDVTGYLDLKY
ncbi:MAG: choice-of-anchor tandem repeat GloVer-containing protein [Bacteroidota bacterium]